MKLVLKSITAVVITAFFLISCKKEADIGKTIYPEDKLSDITLVDTIGIELSTVYNDTNYTYESLELLAGNYLDPDLGIISAKSFAQVRLVNAVGVNLGRNPVLDSIALILSVNYFYGDTLQPQTLNVHRLSSDMNKATNYKSNDEIPYLSTTLGSTTYKFSDFRGKELRVRLDDALGTEILGYSDSVFRDNAKFMSKFKGIALIPGTENGTVTGFTLLSNLSFIRLYYKNDSLSNQFISFPINSESAKFNNYLHNKAGTSLSNLTTANQKINSSLTNNKVFIQAGTGLRTKIEMPTVVSFLKNLEKEGKLIINKAEITLPLVDGSVKSFGVPSPIKVFESNSANSLIKNGLGGYYALQVDGYPVTASLYPLNVYYSSEANMYTFSCTTYIEALLKETKANNGILLIPDNNMVSVNRAVIDVSLKPKLKLYYSILK